jgi:hypothetical protein
LVIWCRFGAVTNSQALTGALSSASRHRNIERKLKELRGAPRCRSESLGVGCKTFNPLVALTEGRARPKGTSTAWACYAEGGLRLFRSRRPWGPRHPHHRNSTIRFLKPQTLVTVRREPRQTVRLGANWCKTLQMVAGACFVLIVRRSSTSPISIAAKSGERISQAIVVGDTR